MSEADLAIQDEETTVKGTLRSPRYSRGVLVFFLVAGVSEGGSTIRTIAVTGQQVPGAPTGVTFLGFGAPTMNSGGRTAFTAQVTGPGVLGTNRWGIYREGSGTLTEVARQGDQAPGSSPIAVFGQFASCRKCQFEYPVLNEAGQVAFLGDLRGEGINETNNVGIYSDASGALAEVARTGGQAPGAPTGVVFSRLDAAALNELGQSAFRAWLTGPGIDSSNDRGVYRGVLGSLEEVARSGQQAPGAPSGVLFDAFDFGQLNPLGQTAFAATLRGPGIDASNDRGMYLEGPSGLTELIREGGQAPSSPAGVTFRTFYTPSINASGQAAFHATLNGLGTSDPSAGGVYSYSSGTLAQVARTGDQAPGAPAGSTFRSFREPVLLSSAGRTAFLGYLSGPGIDPNSDSAVYSEDSEGPALLAREGDQVPSGPAGVVFREFAGLNINKNGQTVFTALLRGTGIDPLASIPGVFATNAEGVLRSIALPGDLLDVNDDPLVEDLRTISIAGHIGGEGLDGGGSSGINDLGQVAFIAWFTDGSQGLFISNLVVVPEPTSAALTALSLLAAGRRERHRLGNANLR